MKRIVVTGAGGQLGRELCLQLGTAAIPLDVDALDLTDAAAVSDVLLRLKPDVVVNCAAYTQVDKAEREPDRCRAVNASAVETIARACRQLDALLVQISTDYVFGGTRIPPRPWREDEATLPQGVYARSKWEGEQAAAQCPRHLIVRTCGLYARPSDTTAQNFVRTMLRLAAERSEVHVVADQYCTPTYVPHLAEAVCFLSGTATGQAAAAGVYHITNAGQTTWHAFAVELFRLTCQNVDVRAITSAEYGAPAPRPSFSALDTGRYDRLGGPPMPDWHAALAEYVSRLTPGVVRIDAAASGVVSRPPKSVPSSAESEPWHPKLR